MSRQTGRLLKTGMMVVLVGMTVLCGDSNLVAAAGHKLDLFPQKKAAIIIDDFGNNMKGTEEMMKLPFPITAAIMPFLPSTKRDARWAHQAGYDVLVHLPMEPFHGPRSWLGPGAIFTNLSDEEIRERVIAAVDNVPYAIGINNHMGSKATGSRRIMRVILQVCKEKGLVFVDSHTNYRSVVHEVANELKVPYFENHIFLDDIHTFPHIYKQVLLLKEHLNDHDSCIAIGHVGTEGKKTAEVLLKAVPRMTNEIGFVRISELVPAGQSVK